MTTVVLCFFLLASASVSADIAFIGYKKNKAISSLGYKIQMTIGIILFIISSLFLIMIF